MPRGITSAATSAPTGGVGATDFTTQATKKAPSFTVETDRGVMMQLEAVACFIKGQLERGVFEVGDIVSVDA